MRMILIGFGTVGQGLVEILEKKQHLYQNQFQFEPEIVGVSTWSRGSLYHPEGLNRQALLEAIQAGSLDHYPESEGLIRGMDSLSMIETGQADTVIEMSHSNFKDAQPALDYCVKALESGKHLILANKGPVALAYTQLVNLARSKGVQLRFEATVMAGTPSLALALESLAGCEIQAIKGILNGTCNFIISRMEAGMDFEGALAEAQALGYAEAEPSADVDGWDAAGKSLILAQAVMGLEMKLEDMTVSGIRQLSLEAIESARKEGKHWRLITSIDAKGARVQSECLAMGHPLATVSGANNAITFSTDLMGDITLIGAGAGRLETGYAIITDLLAIHRQL